MGTVPQTNLLVETARASSKSSKEIEWNTRYMTTNMDVVDELCVICEDASLTNVNFGIAWSVGLVSILVARQLELNMLAGLWLRNLRSPGICAGDVLQLKLRKSTGRLTPNVNQSPVKTRLQIFHCARKLLSAPSRDYRCRGHSARGIRAFNTVVSLSLQIYALVRTMQTNEHTYICNRSYVVNRAQTAHDHEAHKTGWDSELEGTFVEFPGPIHSFLTYSSLLLPIIPHQIAMCPEYSMLCPRPGMRFVKGVNTITSDISADKRPYALDTHTKRIRVPFPKLEDVFRDKSPDGVVSVPGREEEDLKHNLVWSNFSTAIEFKALKSLDPMWMPRKEVIEKEGEDSRPLTEAQTRKEVKRQLAINARNLMHAHTHSFVFVIGIYGANARIFRFDRTLTSSGPSSSASFTLGLATQLALCERYTEELPEDARDIGRWFQIPSSDRDHDGELGRFLAIDLRFIHSTLFGRATTAWITLKRTYDGHPEDGLKYAVKDSWRELMRPYETAHLIHLKTHCGQELHGLPQVDAGGDLKMWEDEMVLHELRSSGLAYQLAGDYLVIDGVEFTSERGILSLRITCHTTISARFSGKTINYERGHMRFATKCVGRMLSTFASTKELVTAMKDAVIGHKNAWEAGVLHRDVSAGNILIVEDHVQKPFRGFLNDFDYSWIQPNVLVASKSDDGLGRALALAEKVLRQRTGTYHYMAWQIIDHADGIVHEVRHDLESFYWVFLWIILNHISHTHSGSRKSATLVNFFNKPDDYDTADAKFAWLSVRAGGLTVVDNAPLTELQARWATLCTLNAQEEYPLPGLKLNHANLLELLDKVLKMGGWPDEDAAKDSVLPKNARRRASRHQAASTGQKRPSTAQDEEQGAKTFKTFSGAVAPAGRDRTA
ncbi:hypothetical protein CERSUDRAFT_124042 [Gelatoporia subvermispora B]|uniref:Fungal-type protein kinase domain-containing protein n=1 Tax=Ceriporiopsis subvermispora (strain B) TaxID=914234 RepID=M2PL77_CERS8|nr:hypothetical protein CERSUDRAFT_124042 [Gelatoporia subvermispora B]